MLNYPIQCLTRTLLARVHPTRRAIVAAIAIGALSAPWPGGAQAADVFAGQAVYEAHCVQCHGAGGRPVLPNVPDFYQGERLSAPDGALVRRIKEGSNLMPSFDRIIKDRDILNALAYIRTLQR